MAIERPDRTASSFPGDVPGKGMLGPLQRYMFLRAGMVTRVDNENYRLDIMWLGGEDGDSGRIERMVTFANWGPRTWFGAMPETGGIAICGYLKWGRGMQTVSTDPVVLTFMPAGYKTGHNFDIIQRYENEYGEKPWSKRTWVEQRRYRQMKLYPGEAGIGSSEASDLRMDEDVVIYNKRLNELHLRAHDQAIVTKSLQRYECTEAGRRWEGMVTRNPATFTGSDRGEKKVPPQKYIMPPWGKKLYIIPIDQPNTIDDDPKNWPWVEVRRHVEEAGDAIMTVSEESEDLDWDEEKIAEEYWRFDMKGKKREACESWSEIESKHPLIEIVHGTLVGDDQFLDGEDPQWGMVLEPLLWSDWEEVLEDTKDQPDPQLDKESYDQAVGWLNPDLLYERPLEVLKEKLTLAGSFRMRMRNDKSRFFYHARTKEGKTLLHMGASSDMDETLGPLRSMEFCSEGSLKFVVGKNLWHGKSVQWESRGAFKAHIGHDYSATKDTTRKYIIHHDEGIYGEHGYHKIDETAKLAPHSDIPVEEPELDAHSVDLNIDHNVHVIIGRDEAPDTYDCITPNTHPLDEKSLVVDTSGCWILHIGLSTKKQDRSVFMETDGGLEFVFGKETEFNRSIDMYNHGAVQISIHDKDNVKGQSLHVESSHGWEIDIDDADDEGYGATVNIRGNVRVNITGDTTLQVLGNVTETVQGNVQRTVQGNLTQMIMGNLTDMVMGNRMHITSGNKMYM